VAEETTVEIEETKCKGLMTGRRGGIEMETATAEVLKCYGLKSKSFVVKDSVILMQNIL